MVNAKRIARQFQDNMSIHLIQYTTSVEQLHEP